MPTRTKSRSTQVPAKIGRPTKYSDEWAEAFCREISQGHSVAEICERREQPSQQSIYTWLRENEHFLERYARAREALGGPPDVRHEADFSAALQSCGRSRRGRSRQCL